MRFKAPSSRAFGSWWLILFWTGIIHKVVAKISRVTIWGIAWRPLIWRPGPVGLHSQTNIRSDYRGIHGVDIRVPGLYWEISSREQENIESVSVLFTARHSENISKSGKLKYLILPLLDASNSIGEMAPGCFLPAWFNQVLWTSEGGRYGGSNVDASKCDLQNFSIRAMNSRGGVLQHLYVVQSHVLDIITPSRPCHGYNIYRWYQKARQPQPQPRMAPAGPALAQVLNGLFCSSSSFPSAPLSPFIYSLKIF